MKLPATLLATLCLTGCETRADFAHRSGPEAPVAEKGDVERVQVEFAKPPAAAPKPIATPVPVVKPVPKPRPKPVAAPKPLACGPCGMG